MRVLLTAINAKYVHTNLALRYLREGIIAEFPEVLLKEFTINEPVARIAEEIFEAKANIIGFSCYIWNLSETLAVIRHLYPVCPDIRFVLGGPEVSFEAAELLAAHPEIDAIITGEGETAFLELLRAWRTGADPDSVSGLVWRRRGEIIENPVRAQLADLSELPIPYEFAEDFHGRLVYVETARGCPFNCQYCLSSTSAGVRFLDPERFRRIFRRLLQSGARTVKFVDRTFNARKAHAFRILDIVKEEAAYYPSDAGIRVHCEMAGELLDAEWLSYLSEYPPDLIQLEIGVQTTNLLTLQLISRPQHFGIWRKFILELQKFGIHLHLDLIAGLPEEDWTAFRTSFNDVYAVRPDMLQLGFLKVLKGSGLRASSKQFGLVYAPDPPYTILQTNVMSHPELLRLRHMEIIVDKYYNSGKFGHALEETLQLFQSPFDFYHSFAEYWHRSGWFRVSWQGKALFDRLWDFLQHVLDDLKNVSEPIGQTLLGQAGQNLRERLADALRFDYYLWERPNHLPPYLQTLPELSKELIDEVQNNPVWAEEISAFKGMDHRQWRRNTAVACFTSDLFASSFYLFLYKGKSQAFPYTKEMS